MPSSAHRKPPTAHHQPTSAGLAALASVAATGEGILAVACPYFLESMPPGSPVQYQLACVTRHRVLYGRPSRSPWLPWPSFIGPEVFRSGHHSQALKRADLVI